MQEEVTIDGLKFSLLPSPHLKFESVSAGKLRDAKATHGRVFVDIPALLSDKVVINSLELENVSIAGDATKRILGWGTHTQAKSASAEIDQVKLKSVKLDVKPALAAFDATIAFGKDARFPRGHAHGRGQVDGHGAPARERVRRDLRRAQLGAAAGRAGAGERRERQGRAHRERPHLLRVRGRRARGQGERHAAVELGPDGEDGLLARPGARRAAHAVLHARRGGDGKLEGTSRSPPSRPPSPRCSMRRACRGSSGSPTARSRTPTSWRPCSPPMPPGARRDQVRRAHGRVLDRRRARGLAQPRPAGRRAARRRLARRGRERRALRAPVRRDPLERRAGPRRLQRLGHGGEAHPAPRRALRARLGPVEAGGPQAASPRGLAGLARLAPIARLAAPYRGRIALAFVTMLVSAGMVLVIGEGCAASSTRASPAAGPTC